MSIRSVLILSTLAIDVFQLKNIVEPILKQPIDKIYDSGTKYSYIIYTKTNIYSTTINHLPILFYKEPHYIIISHSPLQIPTIFHESIKKDKVVWYNFKEQLIQLWKSIDEIWYDSYY